MKIDVKTEMEARITGFAENLLQVTGSFSIPHEPFPTRMADRIVGETLSKPFGFLMLRLPFGQASHYEDPSCGPLPEHVAANPGNMWRENFLGKIQQVVVGMGGLELSWIIDFHQSSLWPTTSWAFWDVLSDTVYISLLNKLFDYMFCAPRVVSDFPKIQKVVGEAQRGWSTRQIRMRSLLRSSLMEHLERARRMGETDEGG